jgi:hypothetical protein
MPSGGRTGTLETMTEPPPDTTPDGSPRPHIVDFRRDTRIAGWPLWGWVVLILATLVETAVVLGLTILIGLTGSSACGEALRRADIAVAQRELLVLAGIAVLPWVVGAVFVRPRWRLLVAAVICATPALLDWFIGRDPSTYGNAFCF